MLRVQNNSLFEDMKTKGGVGNFIVGFEGTLKKSSRPTSRLSSSPPNQPTYKNSIGCQSLQTEFYHPPLEGLQKIFFYG
jgi:hypothetical protein